MLNNKEVFRQTGRVPAEGYPFRACKKQKQTARLADRAPFLPPLEEAGIILLYLIVCEMKRLSALMIFAVQNS